jgi:hypothetical protein
MGKREKGKKDLRCKQNIEELIYGFDRWRIVQFQ